MASDGFFSGGFGVVAGDNERGAIDGDTGDDCVRTSTSDNFSADPGDGVAER